MNKSLESEVGIGPTFAVLQTDAYSSIDNSPMLKWHGEDDSNIPLGFWRPRHSLYTITVLKSLDDSPLVYKSSSQSELTTCLQVTTCIQTWRMCSCQGGRTSHCASRSGAFRFPSPSRKAAKSSWRSCRTLRHEDCQQVPCRGT